MLPRKWVSYKMVYPTLEEVESADRVQLAKWFRFLPSAGHSAIGNSNFAKVFRAEQVIMQRIIERFDDEGGMDSMISKQIGWERR